MRQTDLHLTDEDRELIESYRAKCLHHAREVNRAHILSALDRGIPEPRSGKFSALNKLPAFRLRTKFD
jgi:hypothetical protein